MTAVAHSKDARSARVLIMRGRMTRRHSMARVVMAELEREAAHRGYTEIELTTGAVLSMV